MSPNQPLPQKENAVFKKILRCYENKQYKNGLKLAKQILSNPKYAEHGETLAMKGLLLNCLRRKDEAYEHVKRGLKSDVKSHVCWHVFGLLQRSDRKYDEAIRAYRNALKCDSDHIQILRDLSLLQIQMRDLEGYKETRHKLFTLRPTQKASWIGLAMSYHLLDDHEMAVKLIDEFLKIQNKTSYDYEQSELLLYELQIIFESGNYVEVLQRMDHNAGLIYDKLSLMEMRAEVYLRLEKFDLAEKLYNELITRNPENKAFYYGMMKARCLDKDEDKVAMLEEFSKKFPRAQIPRRLPLNMSSGETFRSLVDDYMRRAITKGVPPLFVDLKPLYADPQNVKIIEELIEMYLQNLVISSTFESAGGDGAELQPVTSVVWTLYLACQHFDHIGDTKRALELVERAIEHTPTLIELYLAKAKFYKHAGNMIGAVQCLDEAQALDTADRYINSKCAKYMLKAKLLDEAEAMCAKFTRENVSAMENLNEMQCMWFQTECANAYSKLNRYGDALKKCHEVDRHFVEIIEDQFDFHTYCMRKTTLRSYIGLLRLEDVVRGHPFYFKAARIAIKTYLRLHDHPLNDKKAEQDQLESTLSKSELKKLRSKQKKAQEKVRQDEKENKDKKVANDDEKLEDTLNPEKLERPENPLEEAIRFLKPLQELSPKNIETHLLAYEIYMRTGKPLLMLQCLKRAHRLQPDHPQLHVCLAHFVSKVANQDLTGPVGAVVEKQLSSLLSGKQKSAKDLNSDFLQQHRDSYAHAVAAATVLYELDKTKQSEALKLLNFEADPLIKHGVTRERCEEVMELLESGAFGAIGDAEYLKAFKNSCARRFPLAEVFQATGVISAPRPASADATADRQISQDV
ncbi:N-alpha-acetyltransferase 15, NatA auxiliary subunit [Galendromus occidentalis]|uniref:N-alpha-acetyltransferase 15, NatA auxiliary subunit n=1 Tax=Galendromus occidentalis TaxID=34638 RepID=A0AAJ6QT15_9ACAR|nr:N-alpha-acetyltransferase 15, NatA auxiliary subunit [Galendromus occidentalis]